VNLGDILFSSQSTHTNEKLDAVATKRVAKRDWILLDKEAKRKQSPCFLSTVDRKKQKEGIGNNKLLFRLSHVIAKQPTLKWMKYHPSYLRTTSCRIHIFTEKNILERV